MKKTLLQFIPCLALTINLAVAGEIKTELASDKARFSYFDGSEYIADFKMKAGQESAAASGSLTAYASTYKVAAPPAGAGTATMCVMVFNVDRVEKGMLSSKKTIYYNREVLNASKLRAVRRLKPEEFAKLGLAADDNIVVRRVDLVGGVSLFAIGPNDSRFLACGRDASGTPYMAENFAETVEFHRALIGQKGDLEYCSAEAKPMRQTLPESRHDDFVFAFGDDAESTLNQCRAKQAENKLRQEEYAAKQAKLRQEGEERFEREKKAHKMISGVEILGNMGAARARDLVYRCLRFNFMTDTNLTKQERKQGKCQGYYEEEVEGLQRELRVRGLDER